MIECSQESPAPNAAGARSLHGSERGWSRQALPWLGSETLGPQSPPWASLELMPTGVRGQDGALVGDGNSKLGFKRKRAACSGWALAQPGPPQTPPASLGTGGPWTLAAAPHKSGPCCQVREAWIIRWASKGLAFTAGTWARANGKRRLPPPSTFPQGSAGKAPRPQGLALAGGHGSRSHMPAQTITD